MRIRLAVAFLLIGLGVLLDQIVRLRLRDVGEPDVFSRGGTLDYAIYLRQAKQHGWSLLPLYLAFPLMLGGVAFMAWALFVGFK